MANYKGIKVPDNLSGLMPHMHEIEEARDEITELNRQWELLTILSQMSDSGMDMGSTWPAPFKPVQVLS